MYHFVKDLINDQNSINVFSFGWDYRMVAYFCHEIAR